MKMRFYIYKYCARHLGEDRIKDICMRNNVPGFFFAYGRNFWFALIKEFPENLDFVNILYCTKEQKKRFKKNIDELKILNPNLKIIETK